MKRILSFLLLLAVGSGLLSWVISQIGWEELAQVLSALLGVEGVIILLLTGAGIGAGAVRWGAILASQGYRLPYSQILQMYLGGFTVSFAAPMLLFGGELFRTYALRSVRDIPFPRALASNVIERIVEVTSFLLVIVVGTALLLGKTNVSASALIWTTFSLVGLLGIAVALFYIRSFQRKSILKFFFRSPNGQIWELEKEVFAFFRWNNKALWTSIFLSFVRSSILFARAWLLILFLGKSVGAISALAALAFQFVAMLAPIPASLGTHDALQLFLFDALGLEAKTGAAFAFTIRSTEVLAALLGAVFMVKFGILALKNAVIKRVERIFA